MKKIVLDDYLRENRTAFTRTRLALEHGGKSLSRSRSPEEWAVLLRLDRVRRERWLKEGALEILGPRRYRLNFSLEDAGKETPS